MKFGQELHLINGFVKVIQHFFIGWNLLCFNQVFLQTNSQLWNKSSLNYFKIEDVLPQKIYKVLGRRSRWEVGTTSDKNFSQFWVKQNFSLENDQAPAASAWTKYTDKLMKFGWEIQLFNGFIKVHQTFFMGCHLLSFNQGFLKANSCLWNKSSLNCFEIEDVLRQ